MHLSILRRKYWPTLIVVLLFFGCSNMQDLGLYEVAAPVNNAPHIDDFYAVNVFNQGLTDENWFTENKACITVVDNKENGENRGIAISWNKKGDGCDWIGFGFGWDGWVGKDLSQVLDKSAIQLKVRNKKQKIKSLPLALGLEDYGGTQAWAGVFPNTIQQAKSNSEWSTVTIPLADFGWKEEEADPYNIKQLVIGFEASGEMELKTIEIVPFSGNQKKQASIYHNDIQLDQQPPSIEIENGKIWINSTKEALKIKAKIKDKTPLLNNQNNADIWNGDALEIAFSTNSLSDPKRSFFKFSDYHIGIRASTVPMIWDWSKKRVIEPRASKVTTTITENGYTIEATINWSELGGNPFQLDQVYGLEIAIDDGNGTNRTAQHRWNNPVNEGFNIKPSMWGQAKVQTK